MDVHFFNPLNQLVKVNYMSHWNTRSYLERDTYVVRCICMSHVIVPCLGNMVASNVLVMVIWFNKKRNINMIKRYLHMAYIINSLSMLRLDYMLC